MELRVHETIATPPGPLLDALRSPRVLAGAFPGLSLVEGHAGATTGRLVLLVGGRELVANGTAALAPTGDDGDTVTWTVSAGGPGGDGQLDGALSARVSPAGEASRIAFELSGRGTGWSQVDSSTALERTLRAALAQFARNLETRLLIDGVSVPPGSSAARAGTRSRGTTLAVVAVATVVALGAAAVAWSRRADRAGTGGTR